MNELREGIWNIAIPFSKWVDKQYGRRWHYIMNKVWQRSRRTHPVKSRYRHAKTLARKGYRYKGGR